MTDATRPDGFAPSRHLLSARRHPRPWPQPPSDTGPLVRLDEPITRWRAEIDAGSSVEPSPERVDAVVVSHARAVVIAALLRELAARLRPGSPVGPVQSDGALSALAEELQEDLSARSWPT